MAKDKTPDSAKIDDNDIEQMRMLSLFVSHFIHIIINYKLQFHIKYSIHKVPFE